MILAEEIPLQEMIQRLAVADALIARGFPMQQFRLALLVRIHERVKEN